MEPRPTDQAPQPDAAVPEPLSMPALEPADPAHQPTAVPPDLRTPGPNQWYSDRFRAAAGETTGTAAGSTVGTGRPTALSARAGLFSDLPFVAPDITVGWVAIAGAWASVLAFLLPWANASGLGYFDSWGLYKVSHLVVFFAALVVALVAVLPLHLPPLVRLALLPLLLGMFEFGLVWEWLGGQAVGLGVWVILFGAALAVAGGLLVASRLADPARPS